MGGIWVHGELAGDGSLARISTEVATLARALGAASGEQVTLAWAPEHGFALDADQDAHAGAQDRADDSGAA